MKMMKYIQTWLLITLLALSASGVANAKLASGHQNLSGNLHQSQTVLNALLHQGLEQVSTTETSGSPLAAKGLKTVVPTLSSGVKVQVVGRDVIKWGSGADEALAITNNLTKARANEILGSVSRSDIVKIRDWYRGVARDVGPAKLAETPTPAYRADMMQRILDLGD